MRRVLILSAHFHFDEIATFSRGQPPELFPICEEPHNRVPTRRTWGHHPLPGVSRTFSFRRSPRNQCNAYRSSRPTGGVRIPLSAQRRSDLIADLVLHRDTRFVPAPSWWRQPRDHTTVPLGHTRPDSHASSPTKPSGMRLAYSKAWTGLTSPRSSGCSSSCCNRASLSRLAQRSLRNRPLRTSEALCNRIFPSPCVTPTLSCSAPRARMLFSAPKYLHLPSHESASPGTWRGPRWVFRSGSGRSWGES